ncbi:MAG: TPM domain-containing protein [Syntrophaceae bacterium]|nr:TPM domain-containing protein [Syntrophaceae bacterium]
MKNISKHKTRTIFVVTLIIVLMTVALCAAKKYPARQGAVNDFANVIDAQNAAKMDALAREVLQKTGTAIVVATVPSIGENEDYNMYANGLYKEWGIGKKGEDKGVLIFLTVKERKIRIETGYGVEGILPDGRVGEILDKYVVPFLKEGNYGKGLYNAMYACSAYIAKNARIQLTGSPLASKANIQIQQKGINVFGLVFFIIAAVLLLGTRTGRSMLPWLLLIFITGGRGGGGFRGGGFGGGFGGFGGGMSGGGGAGRGF